MSHQRDCADWKEMLAVSHPEEDLLPAEYAALQEHLARCAHCTALQNRYLFLTEQLRGMAIAGLSASDAPSIFPLSAPPFGMVKQVLYKLSSVVRRIFARAAGGYCKQRVSPSLSSYDISAVLPHVLRDRRHGYSESLGTNLPGFMTRLRITFTCLAIFALVIFAIDSLAVISNTPTSISSISNTPTSISSISNTPTSRKSTSALPSTASNFGSTSNQQRGHSNPKLSQATLADMSLQCSIVEMNVMARTSPNALFSAHSEVPQKQPRKMCS